jgi:hypothetical protein
MAGLIELVLVVGLLYWFWKTQAASSGKGKYQDQGKDGQVKK